ncbi:hypothetical protein [Microbacterium sp. P5_E9]
MLYITDAAIHLERQHAAERARARQIILLQKERPTTEPLQAARSESAWHRSLVRWHVAPRWVH